jgi:serine/threonine-protein kinase
LVALGGAAYGAWAYLIPRHVDVPKVVGLTLGTAQDRLQEAGLVVRMTGGRYSPTVVQGVVLEARPAAGTTLERGDRVVLVPSLGHAPVETPDLIGASLAKAKSLLRDADLRPGGVSHAYSDAFTAGQVMKQSVRAGRDAPYRSEIDLVLSKGPVPVRVPHVVGKAQDQATEVLTTAGFLVDASEDHSQDVPRGKVISQNPPDGELQPGETVSIVVSLGPPEFPMPNVVGMSRDAAVAKLQDLGLEVSVSIVPGHSGTRVVFQEPASGATVHAGDTVSVYVA